jgi:cell shape-determining protein MreC
MKRFRLRTLMLLVVIAALVAAFLVQHRRTAQIEAERQASVAESTQQTQRLFAAYGALVRAQVQAESRTENQRAETKKPSDEAELARLNSLEDDLRQAEAEAKEAKAKNLKRGSK